MTEQLEDSVMRAIKYSSQFKILLAEQSPAGVAFRFAYQDYLHHDSLAKQKYDALVHIADHADEYNEKVVKHNTI